MNKVKKMTLPPFKVGGKVEPPFFVGREDQVKILVNDAKTLSQNNIIIAPRRYVKTSLLHNVKVRTEAESDTIVVEINCREMDNISDFYSITIAEILRSYEKKHRLKGLVSAFQHVLRGKVLDAFKLIGEVGGSLAKVGEFYLKFREQSVGERELIKATFDFIRSFSGEKDQNLVIIFDEFQKTDTFNGSIYEFFKSSMDSQGEVRYFFSGSSLSLLEKVFLKEDSPLYLMAAKHFMMPLTEEVVSRYVRERFGVYEIVAREEAAKEIFLLTGGIPFYVQKLGLLCFQDAMINERKEIEIKHVDEAFKMMLEEFDGEFEARLISRFSDQQREIIKVVASLCPARMVDIASSLKCESSAISSSVFCI